MRITQMYTAMALVALTMGNLTSSPKWLDDYRAAQAQVTVAGKPMAVFVGSGKDGQAAAIRDGFDPAVTRLLAEKFVCLYVDRSTPAGQKLATALEVGDRGIVLSDRTGLTQAYSAAGTISRAELSRALVAYGDVQVAQKTDTPKATTGVGSSGGAPMAVPVQGAPVYSGTVIGGPGAPMMGAPGYMPGPGGPMMAPPGYMGGPAMMGGGGYGYGGGGCGQGGYAAGGCGQGGGYGGGHGCCFLGGFGSKFGGGGCGHGHQMAAPVAHQGGCGQSQGCGMGGHGFGGGSKCGGLFGGFGGGMGHGCGGFGGGWGGGFGGGMGHGCGGCK